MAAIAEALGTPLMPWQRQVADVACELVIDEDSGLERPAFQQVIVSVMRQSGKTSLVLAVECDRCLSWGKPMRVAYTAQTGSDGKAKMVDEQFPILKASALDAAVRRYYQSADKTQILFRNGSQITGLASAKESGHGKVLDLAVIDEGFADIDDRREQALSPAMITRPWAQLWNTSNAGTEESLYLKSKVELGRQTVQDGVTEGIAYFEWSIPPEDDVYSEDVWRRYMPAFGLTQPAFKLRAEAKAMKENEFRRAYGNQWVGAAVRLIPDDQWQPILGADTATRGRTAVAVAVSPMRDTACIAAADTSGNCEIVDHRPGVGVGWVTERVAELVGQVGEDVEIVVDRRSHAARFGDEWKAMRLPVVDVDTLFVQVACQAFFDNVMDRRIRIRRYQPLTDAVASAKRRSVGQMWVWDQSGPTDATPLVAATLALGHAYRPDTPHEIGVMVI